MLLSSRFPYCAALCIAIVLSGCAHQGRPVTHDPATRDLMRYNQFKDREKILGEYYQDMEGENIWSILKQNFSLPVLDNQIVRDYEHWLFLHPEHLNRVSKRVGIVLPYIIEETSQRGLPIELALLPIIESGLNTHAVSHANAAGLWQIMPGTGKWLGLQIDGQVDERRNIVDSTTAALDYLEQLHEHYEGNWALAITSYNAGNGNVDNALERAGSGNDHTRPSKLPLNKESRTYYPKLIGLRNYIAKTGSEYPELEPIRMEEFFTASRTAPGRDFSQVAREYNTDIEVISFLNADYLDQRTLKRRTTILVPADYETPTTAEQFALDKIFAPPLEHRIRSGENLGLIARMYNTTVNRLKSFNNLGSNLIHAGQTLLIPVYN